MDSKAVVMDSGLLRRPGGAEIHWEASGNPDGIPVLYLHGGPGSGLGKGGYRKRHDPNRFLTIGLDQRGCGRSVARSGIIALVNKRSRVVSLSGCPSSTLDDPTPIALRCACHSPR